MSNSCLPSVIERFRFYKGLGEAALEQIPDAKLQWAYNESCNSAFVLVKHISGNMRSRFTDFLTSDGEKPWRNRDGEFEKEKQKQKEEEKQKEIELEGRLRQELMRRWEEGWECLFSNIDPLTEADLERTVYIRNEPHTVIEALNRQLGHYAYHIGQIVQLGKMICGENWKTLSIAKGQSEDFNRSMFSKGEKGNGGSVTGSFEG